MRNAGRLFLTATAVVAAAALFWGSSATGAQADPGSQVLEPSKNGSLFAARLTQRCPAASVSCEQKLTAWKFNKDGRPKKAYGQRGRIRVSLGDSPGGQTISGVALDTRGRLVIASTSGEPIRATARGKLDPSFDAVGAYPPGFEPASTGNAVAIDGSDRILITGLLEGQLVVVRLSPSGDLDTTYGTGGVATFDPALGVYLKQPSALAVTPAGGAVIASVIGDFYVRYYATTRLLPDGSRDLTFGSGGTAAVAEQHGEDPNAFVSALLVDPSRERYLIAGGLGAGGVAGCSSFTTGATTFSGDPDSGFGRHSLARSATPGCVGAADAVLLKNGAFAVVGGAITGEGFDASIETASVAKYDAAGHAAFGDGRRYGGAKSFRVGGNPTAGTSLISAAQGKLIVGGFYVKQKRCAGSCSRFFIERLTAQGKIDKRFGRG